MANARTQGDYLAQSLKSLINEFPQVGTPRGLGLMQAIDILKGSNGSLDHDRRNRVVNAAFERGLLLLGCGEGAIRFLPALNVESGHIDAAVAVLEDALRHS